MSFDTSSSPSKFAKDEYEPTQAPYTVLRAADIELSNCLSLACGICSRSAFFWAFENLHCYLSLAQTGQSQG